MTIETQKLRAKGITRVISFTSGKGGVGKSNSVINIGMALSKQGRSVLLFDADLGLANLDVLLGIRPKATLNDVLNGDCSLRDIILDGPGGLAVIPAASGVESICSLSQEQRIRLLHEVEDVAAEYDYLLIDTQAGISSEVMYFNAAASEIVCIINGEPTSLTDSYAVIKILSRNYGERSISILVNNIENETDARKAFERLSKAVTRFLHVDLKYLGFIPNDIAVREAVSSQQAVMELYPSSRAGLAFLKVAATVDATFLSGRIKGGMQFFFKQLLEVSDYGR